MTTILKNRLITTDVANPSTVGSSRGVNPSTVGIQNGAKYTPREQRAAKSTTEKGERFTGKQLKAAVGDWMKSVRVTADALQANANGLSVARAAGDEVSEELFEQVACAMIDRLAELAQVGLELQKQFPAQPQATQQPTPQAEETTDETGTGEIPHSGAVAGALDAAAMDAGRAGVLDYFGVSSVEYVATVDAETRAMASAAEWKKAAIQIALDNGDELEANRIRFGFDYVCDNDPVGTMKRKYGSAE